MGFIDASGDAARYAADRARVRARLEAARRVLLVGHGDCDGTVAAGLVLRFLSDRGVACAVASTAEFRAADFARVAPEAARAETVVLLECQGSSPEWAALDHKAVVLDHHPPDPHVRSCVLNPRAAGLSPNPAAALVALDLVADALQPEALSAARWMAAAASTADRCRAAAATLIAAEAPRLARIEEIEDTFLAIQYDAPLCVRMIHAVATMPAPDFFLASEPFAGRRDVFRRAMRAAGAAAEAAAAAPGLLFVRLAAPAAGAPRIASPLATRLGEAHPDRVVAVAEVDEAAGRARLSFRAASGGRDLGRLLGAAAADIEGADASGHERAASARVPLSALDRFLGRAREALA